MSERATARIFTVQSPATVAERRGVEQVAAVLTAKGRIAAATYRMTLAHAV